jgi:hypothetical protein
VPAHRHAQVCAHARAQHNQTVRTLVSSAHPDSAHARAQPAHYRAGKEKVNDARHEKASPPATRLISTATQIVARIARRWRRHTGQPPRPGGFASTSTDVCPGGRAGAHCVALAALRTNFTAYPSDIPADIDHLKRSHFKCQIYHRFSKTKSFGFIFRTGSRAGRYAHCPRCPPPPNCRRK